MTPAPHKTITVTIQADKEGFLEYLDRLIATARIERQHAQSASTRLLKSGAIDGLLMARRAVDSWELAGGWPLVPDEDNHDDCTGMGPDDQARHELAELDEAYDVTARLDALLKELQVPGQAFPVCFRVRLRYRLPLQRADREAVWVLLGRGVGNHVLFSARPHAGTQTLERDWITAIERVPESTPIELGRVVR